MQYQVVNQDPKVLSVACDPKNGLSLEDIKKIIQKEFPGFELNDLVLITQDNPYVIHIMERSKFETA